MKNSAVGSILALVVSLACTSQSALAGGDSGLYLGLGVGQSSFEIDELDGDNFDFDDDDNAYKVMLGYNFGWIPLLDIAVEADYRDLGAFAGSGLLSGVETDVTALDLFGVINWKLGLVGVFAKVGFVNWDVDATIENLEADDSGTDLAYGLGAQLRFGSFAVRGEFERFDIEDVDELHMLSIGATYTF